jgi:hypothetical protein
MSKHYLILSLKHSEGTQACFWRANDQGYTTIPFNAGLYTKEQVESNPKYYNNGYDTIAIPYDNEGLDSMGFKCTMDLAKVQKLARKVIQVREMEVNNG